MSVSRVEKETPEKNLILSPTIKKVETELTNSWKQLEEELQLIRLIDKMIGYILKKRAP